MPTDAPDDARVPSRPEQLFIIYDERAMPDLEGPDDAVVLCTARSLREARRDVRRMFPRGVIYQYDVRKSANGERDELVNEMFVEDN